ncbi:MAG: cell division protein CrgA [Aeriscardovia sp.]|nr:cell division protein CrgA [Aeriscardovia sp.]
MTQDDDKVTSALQSDSSEITSEQSTSSSVTNDTSADDLNNAFDLDKVDELLNKDPNSEDLPKSLQRLMNRQQDQTKRVEKTIAQAKTNRRWFVPTFIALLVVGLAWVVTNYITAGSYPIPKIGNWNLLIGFAIMLVGFIMTMWWN